MKNSFSRSIAAGLLALPAICSAALVDRGGGLLYDDVLNITWLQDANYAKTSGYDSDGYMSWAGAKAWAAQLNYGDIGGWRLPSIKPIGTDWFLGVGNNSDLGYNKNTPNNELGFMYYNNLGLKSFNEPGGGLLFGYHAEFGLVRNLIAHAFWTNTEFSTPNQTGVFVFDFTKGFQDISGPNTTLPAWAVHDGDIGIINLTPEPGTTALFFSAISGLLISRRYQRKTQSPEARHRQKFVTEGKHRLQ